MVMMINSVKSMTEGMKGLSCNSLNERCYWLSWCKNFNMRRMMIIKRDVERWDMLEMIWFMIIILFLHHPCHPVLSSHLRRKRGRVPLLKSFLLWATIENPNEMTVREFMRRCPPHDVWTFRWCFPKIITLPFLRLMPNWFLELL